ncbi:MAG: transposase [Planctomycetes bacterium]|nr:transposase [Planctomycetota bacterium]
MTDYRRAKASGQYYFFTVVTYDRRELFYEDDARRCLRHAWRVVREKRPFELTAVCLLPDHLHCVWKLPQGDADFSTRWSSIKGVFTREYLKQGGRDGLRNVSRQRRREAAVWQRRFWEHQIRDEDDLQHHVDYIHFNPVKHGLVTKVADWPWSTYHRYVKMGGYGGEWERHFVDILPDDMELGE